MSTVEMTAPDRSLEQRRAALGHANAVRSFRAELKREIKTGERQAFPTLLDPPAGTETMKVLELLLAIPKVGWVKAHRTLNRCRVSPSKTLSGLTERQRAEIVTLLGRRG